MLTSTFLTVRNAMSSFSTALRKSLSFFVTKIHKTKQLVIKNSRKWFRALQAHWLMPPSKGLDDCFGVNMAIHMT